MADNRKLAQGLMMMTPSARADLAGREQDIQRGKTVELLRRAGKEMYDNPIVNTAIGFTPVLGDVQAAGETMSALNRGAPWQETAGYAAGMLPFVPMIGKTVWHGSPHTFDKFDLSKIGTGEGAQAYGHGLYLAEARPTAEGYRESLAGKKMTDEEIDGMIRYAEANARKATDEKVRQGYTNAAEEYRQIKANEGQPGYLYKVDLPDEQIAKMLDWDKPITEEMRKPISQAMMEKFGSGLSMGIGEQAYKQIVDEFKFAGSENPKVDATRWMVEQGVPGIQYLDQASRGAGEGTRNYVVFSDEIPQILERNGQPVAQALREYKQTPSFDEFRSMAASGKMRQAKTEAQELEDLLSGKSKFAEVRWNWDDPDIYDKADELAALGYKYKQSPNFRNTFVYKEPEDIAKIENAKTPIQFGEAYGYSPNDIASFYMNRRQAIGNAELENFAYKEYLQDLVEGQK